MMFDLFKIVIFHSYVKLPEGACVHVYVYIYICVCVDNVQCNVFTLVYHLHCRSIDMTDQNTCCTCNVY